MLERKKVEDFFKKIGIEELVTNLQIIENDVYIDMVAHSPAMHEKKKLEIAIKEAFSKEFNNQYILKLKISSPETKPKPSIRGKEIQGVKNIIVIASGKGGVGKSTVVANLAVILSKMGFKVGLLDADIYGPSIPTMFSTEGDKPSSVQIDGKHLMKPIEQYGIMLSIGYFSGANKAVVWRGPMAGKALHQMIRDTDWGELD